MDVRERFDIVLAMEVVEHVSDVGMFLNRCAAMLKPGGMMVVSTLNRNWKSFALAIVGAEYVLRWLPRGTHQWDKFVTPDELAHHLANNKLAITEQAGVVYSPVRRQMEPLVGHGRELHGGGGGGVDARRPCERRRPTIAGSFDAVRPCFNKSAAPRAILMARRMGPCVRRDDECGVGRMQ